MSFRKHVLIVATLFLTACQSVPLQESFTDPVTHQVSQDQMQRSIMDAAQNRGWLVTPVAPGELRAELNVRTHQLVTRITFDQKNITIQYVSSSNLDANKGKIHKKYNSWVNNLRQDIKLRLHQATVH